MKILAAMAVFGLLCLAGEPRKPACNAQNAGRLWPEEGNRDSGAARELYQRGELEMCSLVVWKYRWEHLSVNAHDLAAGHRTAPKPAPKTAEGSVAGDRAAPPPPAR